MSMSDAQAINDGPFNLLTQAVKAKTPVLVSLRNNKKLYGRVKAFDRHFNLIMVDVTEMWEHIPAHLKDQPGAKKQLTERHLAKLFVRGDGVILVVRDPKV